MTSRHTLLIVDDHPLFREGLKSIIAADPRFEVLGEAGDGSEAVRLARELNPELVLMDISLPDESGIQVTRTLRTMLPQIRIMMVSMHSKIDTITEAFQAGAMGYLVKESAADRLVQGLEAIARGEYFLDSCVAHLVVEKLMHLPKRQASITDTAYATLTRREQEVTRLLAEGHSAKEVAAKLCISPKTVENHRSNILGKLGLHSTLELVRYAARLGLVDVDLWKE